MTGTGNDRAPQLDSDGAPAAVIGPYLARELHDSRWCDPTVRFISGGKSNLTYLVSSPAGDVILRRPPLHGVGDGAHDVLREHAVMTALRRSTIPVPRTLLAVPEQSSPLRVPFYVMEYVLGHICRDGMPDGYAVSSADRRAVGLTLVDVLADIHLVDLAAVGLQGYGRPSGYLERQMLRWRSRCDEVADCIGDDFRALAERLAASLPMNTRTGLIHGDYRLDNTILHPHRVGEIVAVLDWELSALGDPLADLAMLLMYWPQADDVELRRGVQVSAPISTLPGYPDRGELVERYRLRTGFDTTDLSWYMAFAYFKLAIILNGVHERARTGAMVGSGFDGLSERLGPLLELGTAALDRDPAAL